MREKIIFLSDSWKFYIVHTNIKAFWKNNNNKNGSFQKNNFVEKLPLVQNILEWIQEMIYILWYELFARFARPSVFDIFYGLSLKKKSYLRFSRVQFGSKLSVLKRFREVDYASIFLFYFQLYIALISIFIRS
mgnify:CR=1 FL=1